MKLTKRQTSTSDLAFSSKEGVNRRAFLKGSGIAASGSAFMSLLPPAMMQQTVASETTDQADDPGEIKKVRSVCSHCSLLPYL